MTALPNTKAMATPRRENRPMAGEKGATASRAPALALQVWTPPAHFEGGECVPAPCPADLFQFGPTDAAAAKTASPASRVLQGRLVLTPADAAELMAAAANVPAHAWPPVWLVGYGVRGDPAVARYLATQTQGIVVAVELCDANLFHLDTCVAVYPGALGVCVEGISTAAHEILAILYPKRLLPIPYAQARQLACNGRLLRCGAQSFVYLHGNGGLPEHFFCEYAALLGGTVLASPRVDRASEAPHLTTITWPTAVAGKQGQVRFVSVPTQQASLAGGSISCLTQVAPDGSVLMVPPDHYATCEGFSPHEAQNVGQVNRMQAAAQYQVQVQRLRQAGLRVHELTADPRCPQQIFTRDVGFCFAVAGHLAVDPATVWPQPAARKRAAAAGPPNGLGDAPETFATGPIAAPGAGGVFLQAHFRNEVRDAEVAIVTDFLRAPPPS